MIKPSSNSNKSGPSSRLPMPRKANGIPDFRALHSDWEQAQRRRKEQSKVKVTIPKEFSFSTSNATSNNDSMTARHMQTSNRDNKSVKLKQVPSIRRQLQNVEDSENFASNPKSQQNIINGRGIRPDDLKQQKSASSKSLNRSKTEEPVDIRRKSLGPPLRAKPASVSTSQVITENEPPPPRLSMYSRKPATSTNRSSPPMSKLERRISTYFSGKPSAKPAGEKDELSQADEQETPGRSRVEQRMGRALMEMRQSPGSRIFDGGLKVDADQEWMQKLYEDLLKKNTALPTNVVNAVAEPIVSKLPPDFVPTPPPPIVVPEISQKVEAVPPPPPPIVLSAATKVFDDEDITFKVPVNRIIPPPLNHRKPSEKSISQLKRSGGTLFNNSTPAALVQSKPHLFSGVAVDSDEDCATPRPKSAIDDATCEFVFDIADKNITDGDTMQFLVPPTPLAKISDNAEGDEDNCSLTPFKTEFRLEIDDIESDDEEPTDEERAEIMRQLRKLDLLEAQLLSNTQQ